MKKLILIIVSLFIIAGMAIHAQHHKMRATEKGEKPMMMQRSMMGRSPMMMHGNMMGMMKGMNCPMCGRMMEQNMPMVKYMMLVNILPNMEDSLSLSQAQVKSLIDMQAEYKKQQIDYMANLAKNQMELKNLLENNSLASDLREQMESCAGIRTEMKISAYETANMMKEELTEDQKAQLKNMELRNFNRMMGRDALIRNMVDELLYGTY